jgi:imidazolonepropionase-like amidohydrolase
VYWAVGASSLTNYEWLHSNQSVLDDAQWQAAFPRVIAEDLRLSLKDLDAHPLELEMPHLRRSVLASRLRSARAAGAHFLLGSLAGEPGHIPSRASWQEAEALVTEAGYTPTEALRAATLDAAFTLGMDGDVGSIVPGKYADIVAIRGDVLRAIDRLADVKLVFRHGQRYAPQSSDREEQL